MKNKKILYTFICVLIISIFILFLYYKNLKFGKNIIKSNLNLKEYILSISSYEATISVEINSNKNTNKYVIKQTYVSPNLFKQEIQAPENIKGLTIMYDGVNLKIENSILSLSKIYNNYNYLSNNRLCLSSFIDEIKDKEIITTDDDNNFLIEIETENKYSKYKSLKINKKTKLPVEMKIMDDNKKTLVYILYNDITINNTEKENII